MPVDKLLQQQEEAYPGFEYLCIQVSMMQFNPVPANQDREFIENGYTAQLSTVDNNKNRLLNVAALSSDKISATAEEASETVASLYF